MIMIDSPLATIGGRWNVDRDERGKAGTESRVEHSHLRALDIKTIFSTDAI